jgi:polyisoprenoid-binding protein YceI
MKTKISYLVFASILFASAALTFAPIDHFEVIDGHSIEFKSKDPSGSFKKLDGTIDFDDANLEGSKFNLSIDVASINTGNGMMNKKAQIEEWFNAGKFPTIKFKSTKVEKVGSSYQITGNITMKGITKEYVIPAAKSKDGKKIVFKGTFYVDRLEFKVGHKSNVVPAKMKIIYSIPAVQK